MTHTTANVTGASMRASLLVLSALLLAPNAKAQDDSSPYTVIMAAAATDPIVATAAGGDVTMLSGSGGNIGVLSGPDGLLMVDAGIPVSKEKITSALQKIGSTDVKYLINTHWHFDHTDGNLWVHDLGATIVSHPNTAKHLGETIRVGEWKHTFDPAPAGARPTKLVETEEVLPFDGEDVRIRPYPHSHTDGDLSVYFPKANVLMTGDTLWNGHYPFIDYIEGGGIDGMIKAADDNLAMITDSTVVIPGHGPIAKRADLVAYRDMLVTIRDRVADLKAKGNTLEQVIAAKPTASFDDVWGKAVISPALFTSLVYRGV